MHLFHLVTAFLHVKANSATDSNYEDNYPDDDEDGYIRGQYWEYIYGSSLVSIIFNLL